MSAKAKLAKRTYGLDASFTVVFLVIQAVWVAMSLVIGFGQPVCNGACSAADSVRDPSEYPILIIINAVYSLLFIGAIVLSWLRLRAKKMAFWVPLLGLGLSCLVLYFFLQDWLVAWA